MTKILAVDRTNQFKRDFKRMMKRGKDRAKLIAVINKLVHQTELPVRCHDHALSGNYQGTRECHLEPDWLLIYTVLTDAIRLERTGTHSDLFR